MRRIFDLYVHEGKGTIAIAALLNAESVPTAFCGQKRGRQYEWSIGVLSRILRNTAYIGHYVAGKRSGKLIAEYQVPTIVDEATFNTAQVLLRERMKDAKRNAHRVYLLRGLIRCHCGYMAIGRGSHEYQVFHYCCPKGHVKLRAEALEQAVWEDVAALARDPGDAIDKLRERLRGQVRDTGDVGAHITEIAGQIAAKKLEQDSIITQYRRGRITEAQLDKQLDDLARETATLEARHQVLLSRQVEVQSRETAMISAEEMLPRLRERVDEIERGAASADPEIAAAALEAKRNLIKRLVDRIQVDENGAVDIRYVVSDWSVHVNVFAGVGYYADRVWMLGEIRNEGNAPAYSITASGRLLAANGSVAGADSDVISYLGPGDAIAYEIEVRQPSAHVRGEVSVTASTSPGLLPYRKLAVSNTSMRKTGDIFRLAGIITNNTPETAKGVSARVRFLDAACAVVDVRNSYVSPSTPSPGGTTNFDIASNSPNSNPKIGSVTQGRAYASGYK